MNDSLETELARLIVEVCNVENILPDEISPEAPLIGPESPLGLDSLDAVEVVVTIQKRYNVRIGAANSSREVLQSIKTLADFIRLKQSVCS